MKKLSLLLCLAMLLTMLGACGGETAPTTVPTTLPNGEAMDIFYDDRIVLADITDEKSPVVTITNQQVTSKAVGTDTPDKAVLTHDEKGKQIIATGTGTATLQVGDKVFNVTVSTAPISLFMITGHSIGAGSCGLPQLSVICPDGQTYNSYTHSTLLNVDNKTGIGWASEKKPDNIDAYTKDAEGTRGEGSGLAKQWIELTGEKVWVINTAVPGSCLGEWQPGKPFYQNAISAFKAAETVLTNEVAAGHYILKDMAIIYHGGTNFHVASTNKHYDYTDETLKEWYNTMWNGFKTEFSKDINGTGTPQTVSAIGLVPIFIEYHVPGYREDVHTNYYMSASDEFSDFFLASDIALRWQTDEGVSTYFPEPNYDTRMGKPQKLTKAEQIYDDGIHFGQLAYNALGADVCNQLHTRLRGEFTFESVTLVDRNDKPIGDSRTLAVGESLSIVPLVDSLSAGGMTFTASGSVSLSYPCVITGVSSGTGKLEITRDGAVVAAVTFTVK